MEELLEKLPKIELHLHIDGSVRVETANFLMGRDVTKEMIYDETSKDLTTYLNKFDLPTSLMQTKENITRISRELAEDLKKDNILYAEVRFGPIQHIHEGLSLEEVVEAALKGLSQVDIKTNLILCMMRYSSFEDNKRIVELAAKYLNKGVCAIDLAGAEALYKTSDFQELFAIARRLNVPFTIHAGEADGVTSIESALNFGTKRLGHGIRCLDDDQMVKRIINDNITLEVCPTSNLNTQMFPDYQSHPIKKLLDLGIKVTVSTDNRTISNVTLTDEYRRLIKFQGFTINDLLTCNINAVEASFLPEFEKKELINELKDKYNKIK